MKKNSLIYVIGHTGLVGSAIVRRLSKLGYRNLLLKTHKELDLTDREKTEFFLKKESPEYVFLAAAKVGGILANSKYPADFIYQNIMMQTNVIHLSYKHKVKKLLFFGSSCVYPKICSQPIKEEYLLSGHMEPTNEPYAVAKIAGIKLCQSYNKQYGTDFISVLPANIYGVGDHFNDEGHVIPNLIRRLYEAKRKKEKSVTIWGTGKPKRDFLYVDDLADACIFLMNRYSSSEIINIGSGNDISIGKLAQFIEKIVGFKGKIIYDRTKPDGMPRRVLDISKITVLGYQPKISLEKGLKLTCKWYYDVQ